MVFESIVAEGTGGGCCRGMPVMLEHLPNEAEYSAAAEHIRAVAAKDGWTL